MRMEAFVLQSEYVIHHMTKLDRTNNSKNWLVFITEMKSVYSAVRTGYLNKAVCAWALKGFIT
jgi:hypothetical protein